MTGMERRRPPGGRRRRSNATAAAVLFLLACHPASAGDEESEREGLRRSWTQACARYDERIDWATRQACNLAWFRTHERDVYRHNLNPHGAAPAAPSS